MNNLALNIESNMDAETQEFYDGVVELFLGVRAGHIGRYCFSGSHFEGDKVRGDEHWTQFIGTTKDYYPYHDEVALIQRNAQRIGQLVADADTFVDLGSGSLSSFERKVLPLVRAGKFENMIFVDLCPAFSKIANRRLVKEKLDIKTSSFIGNFFYELPQPSGKAVIDLFGITLGNIIVDLPRETPEDGLTRTMKHFAASLTERGGYFLFTYDTNQDEAAMHASYEHSSYHAMEMTIAERVKRDLPTKGYDPDDFEHVTVWYPQWSLLGHGLRAKRAVHFELGPYQISFPKGKFLRTGSSFKYSDELIQRVSHNAGFEHTETFTLPGSTMRLAVLHRPQNACYQVTPARMNERFTQVGLASR